MSKRQCEQVGCGNEALIWDRMKSGKLLCFGCLRRQPTNWPKVLELGAKVFADVCDCAFDQVPLRGPDPECTACHGTGELTAPSRANEGDTDGD